MAQIEQHVWAYKDAILRGDHAAADRAWRAYHAAKPPLWPESYSGLLIGATMPEMVRLAAVFGEIDRAADEILECYPLVDTRDVEDDNTRRANARTFVSICIALLECESSIDHPREAEIDAAMRDIAVRIESVLMDHHHRGFQRIGEIRAFYRARVAIAETRRSAASSFDGLPPLSRASAPGEKPEPPAVADPRGLVGLFGLNPRLALRHAGSAIDTAETHDDTGPLVDLVRRLDEAGTCPGLTQLVRARLHVVMGDLPAAMRALEVGARGTDVFARRLRPQILATQALIGARIEPGFLDKGIELCREGRKAGLRWWRRTTPADAGLVRLLLWRALRPGTPSPQQFADVREAVRLIRRTCRIGRLYGADDLILFHETIAAYDALTGRRGDERRNRAWRSSVDAPWSTAARARLAAAWAQWAVGTGVPEFAAEAYGQLVALVAQDAVARYGTSAKERVLATAQEYAEEAGYWLARTGRYREAVLALEIGRAVSLTQVLIRDNAALLERLHAAGRADLAEEYRHAVNEFDTLESQPSPILRQTWARLRDIARQVTAVTGTDPLAPDVNYDDIIAETGDGALVYLAAAKAGGYALVVASDHDPQYIDLPKLDRASVAQIVGKVLPEAEPSTGFARLATVAGQPGLDGPPRTVRELAPELTETDPMADGLRTLWNDGVKDLVLLSARGRIVTLVPVGLLNLLPLHASGEPGTPGHEFSEWRHAGHFSAIRYAPNARALRRCRDIARELADREQKLLAVDVPDGYGICPGSHLRYAANEATEVTRRWTGRTVRLTHSCTWEEFHAAAGHHTVWHLACHGSAEPRSISGSRLYFADRQVTLEELRRTLKPSRRRLAVLSACQTNLTGSAMPNEIVGLPSVLIQIGFAGVIASAWAVDDLATTYLMTVFYERWCRHGDEPAVALNRAQQWLRKATRADLTMLLPDIDPEGSPGEYPYVDPRYWAAFAYTGA